MDPTPPSERPLGAHRVHLDLAGEPYPGAPPGTLVLDSAARPDIHLIDYCETHVIEKVIDSVDEITPYLVDNTPSITWIDVRGISHQATFERLGEIFHIHPLALEDVVNVPQRPKTDAYPEQQLLISRMAQLTAGNEVRTEQIAILFGHSFVLTVQESKDSDVLEPVRARIRSAKGKIRRMGADYLAYALLDAIIDGFYPVLETLGERLETLELAVANARRNMPREIHRVKRELLVIRRAIWPQRDLINALLRDESPHVSADTRLYLRDTYDHTVQVMDMVETFREIASGLMDLHLSSVSNRMNEIMKVLTIISTIFLPITFIAGLYGMNFDPAASPYNMPELHWRHGYPFALVIMVISVVIQLIFYRHKGWIGGRDRGAPTSPPDER